jgi:hypothetical protein
MENLNLYRANRRAPILNDHLAWTLRFGCLCQSRTTFDFWHESNLNITIDDCQLTGEPKNAKLEHGFVG